MPPAGGGSGPTSRRRRAEKFIAAQWGEPCGPACRGGYEAFAAPAGGRENSCGLLHGKAEIHRRVVGDAVLPVADLFDEATPSGAHRRPAVMVVEHVEDGVDECFGAAGFEELAGFAVANQFLVASDVGRYEKPALRHGLERLQRGDELSEAHGVARVSEQVDLVVVAADSRVISSVYRYWNFSTS